MSKNLLQKLFNYKKHEDEFEKAIARLELFLDPEYHKALSSAIAVKTTESLNEVTLDTEETIEQLPASAHRKFLDEMKHEYDFLDLKKNTEDMCKLRICQELQDLVTGHTITINDLKSLELKILTVLNKYYNILNPRYQYINLNSPDSIIQVRRNVWSERLELYINVNELFAVDFA